MGENEQKQFNISEETFRSGKNRDELKAEIERQIQEKIAQMNGGEIDDMKLRKNALESERVEAEKRRQERISRREKRKRREERQARRAEEARKAALEAEAETLPEPGEPVEGQLNMSDFGVDPWSESIGEIAGGKGAGLLSKVKEKGFFGVGGESKKEAEAGKAREGRRPGGLRGALRGFAERLLARERELGSRAGDAVAGADRRIDARLERAEAAVGRGLHRLIDALRKAERNKILLLKYLSLVFIGTVATVAIFTNVTAFQYSYAGHTLGVVKNEDDVIKILDIVSRQLTKRYGAEVSIDAEKDLSFRRVFSIGKEEDSTEDVLDKLTYLQDINAQAWGLYVDGVRIAVVDTEDSGNTILQQVKGDYVSRFPSNYLSVDFAENVELRQINTTLGRIMDNDDVLNRILTGGQEQKIHTVESGETFSGIAAMYGVSQDELLRENPDINPNRLSVGQEIVLDETVPLISVQTVEIAEYVQYIAYEREYEDNSSMYIGESRVKVEGKNGERDVTARVVKNNGEIMATIETSSELVSLPVNEVIYRGTKELPPLQGTGQFKYPVSGYRISSGFGMRWGRMHYGLDLACAHGTPIRASDGGTVIFSGYSGSYGNVIKVDHGGGFVTVYAHCSKLLVSKGDRVYQGQHIGNVGSTGRATGPHCHFEIQKNGVQVNPLIYL